MTVQIASGNIAVTINYDVDGVLGGSGIGDVLSTTGERICTVALNISNQNASAGVSWDEIDSGSGFQIVNSTWVGSFAQPLPVELSSFTSKYLNDKIQLNWLTKTEVNNCWFNIERRIKEGEWNNIGFVEGHGNSNSPKEYSYIENDLFAGESKFQYRLKQVDAGGQFEYSDVVEVEIAPTKFELL